MTHPHVWHDWSERRHSAQPFIAQWVTRSWVMSHVWMGHVTPRNGSCHTLHYCYIKCWAQRQTEVYARLASAFVNDPFICHMGQSRRESMRDARPTLYMKLSAQVDTSLAQMRVLSHMWMSRVTHMDESCHSYGYVMSHISTSLVTHVNASCHTYEWVLSHTWMSHVTHMGPSCLTCGQIVSHMWMSHVAHMNESCHTNEWVISNLWISHITHKNESCPTYGHVMSHIWTNHVTHMDASCHTYGYVMAHVKMSHVTHMNKSCHTYRQVIV